MELHVPVLGDGDIVMRVQREFARESGRELMKVHNETVQAAVGFWKVLVDVIGSALKWFVGKRWWRSRGGAGPRTAARGLCHGAHRRWPRRRGAHAAVRRR